MELFFIICGIVCAFFALFLLVCYVAYRRAFFSRPDPNKKPYVVPQKEQYQRHKDMLLTLIGELDSAPFEPITITSHDGLKLYGRYYHFCDNAPLHIDFHGYRSMGTRDFCGGYRILNELGHNAIIIDQRAHAKSEGNTITFGVKERYDCLDWINYANSRFGSDTPIFISGVSMGAGTVLMASGLELPQNVVGIFADCPFSSPWDILGKVCGDMGLPRKLCFPVAYVAARLFAGFKLTEASAVDAVKHSKTPILIIHGDDDRLVPHEMSQKIADANPDMVRLVTVKNAGHALAYFEDPELYHKEFRNFTKLCLTKDKRYENI